jgi:dTDP-4-dehydrorhamnose reductase
VTLETAASTRDRVLVIGASGQVGRALCSAFEREYAVVPASYQHLEPGHRYANLADIPSLVKLCEEVRPDVVLLAGAMCHVDGCEREPELCRRVNVGGTEAIVRQMAAAGGTVVFFSTDHVFDGSRESHRETDPVAPLNVYSASKAKAEDILRAHLPARHLVLRTSWVYGFDVYRRNFILRLVDQLSQGTPMTVPEDQWGSPTFAADLATATRVLLESGQRGTFHATGIDFVTRAELARRVCVQFDLDPALVIARATKDLGQAAPRVLKVRLDCEKLERAGVEPFRGLDAGLQALRAWSETWAVPR